MARLQYANCFLRIAIFFSYLSNSALCRGFYYLCINNVFCAIKKRCTDASVTEKIIVEYIKLRNMKSLLIKDTTISERAQIVREALGAESDCEGIDLSDMYDDYIYGFKEIAEIT